MKLYGYTQNGRGIPFPVPANPSDVLYFFGKEKGGYFFVNVDGSGIRRYRNYNKIDGDFREQNIKNGTWKRIYRKKLEETLRKELRNVEFGV